MMDAEQMTKIKINTSMDLKGTDLYNIILVL